MKKGFTLIELLAVIIILSLIGLVSIIGITTIIKHSKEDLYETQMKSIESAAKQWGNDNIDKLPSAGECIYMTLDNLKTYGLLDNKLVDPRTDEQIDDTMKIKIYSEMASSYGRAVIKYEIDADDVSNCRNIYGDYTLIEGVEFNKKIKSLAGSQGVIDSNIISIVFLKAGQIPNDISKDVFESYSHIDLSVNNDSSFRYSFSRTSNNDSSVIGYYVHGTVYVYSDGILQSNAVSNNMFYGLSALTSIDFSGLYTENVVSMSSMFEMCSNLKILNLSNFDTSNTLRMDSMFSGCSSLQTLDISSFDISKVSSTNGSYSNMFNSCNSDVSITINSSIKNFIEARLTDNNIGINLTIK